MGPWVRGNPWILSQPRQENGLKQLVELPDEELPATVRNVCRRRGVKFMDSPKLILFDDEQRYGRGDEVEVEERRENI
jgi:hypothetical protein